jgi:hypothetical protein
MKEALIKIGYQHPDLRKHLRPILEALEGRPVTAGILEAPPAAIAEIEPWGLSLIASQHLHDLQKEWEETESHYQRMIDHFRDHHFKALDRAQEAIERGLGLRAEWAAYKEYADMAGYHFYAVSYKDFQKYRKEGTLLEEIQSSRESVQDHLNEHLKGRDRHLSTLKHDMAEVREFLEPGQKPGPVTKETRKLTLDQTGWRYENLPFSKALLNMKEDLKKSLASMLEREKLIPEESRTLFEDMIQTLRERIEDLENFSYKFTVTMTMSSNYSSEKVYGSWVPASRILNVVLPPKFTEANVAAFRKTLRHELQHLAQSVLLLVRGGKDYGLGQFGMPPRSVITPEFTPSMGRSDTDPKTEEARKSVLLRLQGHGIDTRTLDLHALADVEFYTRLADAIGDFKTKLNYPGNLTEKEKRIAVRLFTGETSAPRTVRGWAELGTTPDRMASFQTPSSFFQSLKVVPEARGKWKVAVREFFKAVRAIPE